MQYTYNTPKNLPNLIITAKNNQLTGLNWETQIKPTNNFDNFGNFSTSDDNQWLIDKTCQQLDEYFAGQRTVFDLPLDISAGTAFHT